MLRLHLIFVVALISFQPALSALAQTDAPSDHQLTLQEISDAAKVYFRDTAEFPMIQRMLLTVTDPSGRVRKQHRGNFDFLLKGYPGQIEGTADRYYPYDADVLTAIAQAWNGTLASAMANNVHAIFPRYLLLAPQAGATLKVLSKTIDGTVTAQFGSSACPAFAFSQDRVYVPKIICGEAEVQLRPDLSMQRFVFDQGGLPAKVKVRPFGKTELQSFHVEIQFQETIVPPDREPYVIPQRVTSTFVTSKGTLTIVSDYATRGPGALRKKFSLQANERPHD